MSNAAQIDYDALAKQAGAISSTPPPAAAPAGGAIDYDALAKQAGATDNAPPPVPETIPGINVPNDYLSKAEDLIGGFTSGAAQNIPFIGKYFKPTPQAQATVVNPDYAKAGQTGGKIYEQALEQMALAGGAKSILGAAAERYLPWLGRFAGPATRIAGEAVGAGTSAGLHEQPIGPAAGIGAGGAAASEAVSAVAPSLVKSALRLTDRMGGRGKTIPQAVLEEVPAGPISGGRVQFAPSLGVTPGTIASRADEQATNLTAQMEQGVHNATLGGAVGSSQPAHDALDAIIAKTPRNATNLISKLNELRPSLDLPNYPAGSSYTPDELLELKRGIGTEINSWPPEWQRIKRVQAVKQQLYGLFDNEIDRLVPENAELNQRISSLIPAQEQAARVSEGAGLSERLMGRLAAHTGALTLAGLGAGGGYERGGIPGALAGGAAGFLLPEIATSPTGKIAMARLMRLGIPIAVARGIVASQAPQAPAPGSAGQFERSMQTPVPQAGSKASQFGTPF